MPSLTPTPLPPVATGMGTIKITDKEFQTLVTFVREKYGINLSQKRILIEGRMTNMLRERGMTTFKEYLDLLFQDSSGKEVTTMLNKLTTNYSFFMRESDHYDFLKNRVLPELVRRHSGDHDLRIWSAGCSSGQEAYTTAMVIDEFFGAQKPQWDARILATDISMNVLTKAKDGIYPADNVKGLPASWMTKYFVKLPNGDYQVCDRIREQVIFRSMNLMDPIKLRKPMDLIFCRNVMIYFEAKTKDALVERFYDVTAPGGYLFIGHSESINREKTRYRYIQPAIYQRGGHA